MLRRLLDSPWTYFAGAALLALVAISTQFEVRLPAISEGRVEDLRQLRERDDLNVVFILIDTLRADRLGVYGYHRPTSPNIDELARGGVVFRNALSQSSWTKTSMASLWTATRPINNGILHYDQVLPQEATLPAELFRQAGYRTAGIWRNGWVAANFGFDQGFEAYVKPRPGRERARIQRGNPSSRPLQGTDEDVVVSAREFLDVYGQERFFLYLHLMDVHQYLFDDGAVRFGTSYSDVYDQAINWTDRLLAVLVEDLAQRDLLSRTLVVIASDHGEAFQEHGWEGHARNLYREVTHVPIILLPPFRLDPGVVVEQTVSNMDLWPTILDLVGLPALPGADGVSLVPLILEAGGAASGGEADGARPAFAQVNQGWGKRDRKAYPIVGVKRGSLQLFRPLKEPERSELYDHASDPKERRNLYASDPEAAAELEALADAYQQNAKSPWDAEPPRVDLSELQLGQLRALGYAVE